MAGPDLALAVSGRVLRFPAVWLHAADAVTFAPDQHRAAGAESSGTLTRTPASFGYADEETQLRARQPFIGLSPRGRVRAVRFNCLVFDNTRVLHARTAFSLSAGSPGWHLPGCYADLDGLASTLAVLKSEETS